MTVHECIVVCSHFLIEIKYVIFFVAEQSAAEEKKMKEEKKRMLLRKLSFRPTVEELKEKKVWAYVDLFHVQYQGWGQVGPSWDLITGWIALPVVFQLYMYMPLNKPCTSVSEREKNAKYFMRMYWSTLHMLPYNSTIKWTEVSCCVSDYSI